LIIYARIGENAQGEEALGYRLSAGAPTAIRALNAVGMQRCGCAELSKNGRMCVRMFTIAQVVAQILEEKLLAFSD
jgi:hypothetical protein